MSDPIILGYVVGFKEDDDGCTVYQAVKESEDGDSETTVWDAMETWDVDDVEAESPPTPILYPTAEDAIEEIHRLVSLPRQPLYPEDPGREDEIADELREAMGMDYTRDGKNSGSFIVAPVHVGDTVFSLDHTDVLYGKPA